MIKSQEYTNCHEPKMDKWEIPNLEKICNIKPSTLTVKYLVKGCIRSNRNILPCRLN